MKSYNWYEPHGVRPLWVREVERKARRLKENPLRLETEPRLARGQRLHEPTQKILDAYELGPAWPWPYTLFAYHIVDRFAVPDSFNQRSRDDSFDEVAIKLEMAVYHADSGERVTVKQAQSLPVHVIRDDPKVVHGVVESLLRGAMMHELNEALFLEGERVRNPHPEGG